MIAEDLLEQRGDDEHHFWTRDSRVHIAYRDFADTRSGDVKAQVEVHWNEEPNQGLAKHGWMALGGTATTWARDLARTRPELTEAEWSQLIQRTSYLAKRRFQEGEPFEHIGDEPTPEKYLLYPFVVASGPSVISSEGGSGKSFLGLATALALATGRAGFLGVRPKATGPVLYLDWEDAKNTHDERAWALCRPLGIEPPRDRLIYSRQRAPLPATWKSIAKKIGNLPTPPVALVIDSVGKARGGDVNSAEDTNRLFAAIDSLGFPAICIDHKSKEAIQRKLRGPIGSVYSWNSARMAWDLEKSQTIGLDQLRVVLRNVKSNSTKLHRSLAWEVTFDNEGEGENARLVGVRYTPIDPNRVIALDFSEMTTQETVLAMLKRADHAMTMQEIADTADAPLATVRKAIQRARQDDLVLMHDGNPPTYELAERHDQQSLPAPF